MEDIDLDEIVQDIYKEYPILAQHNFKVVDSRNRPERNTGRGLLEYFPKGKEDASPDLARNVIELYSPELNTPDRLKSAIFGDMLHAMDDEEWKRMKNEVYNIRSPEHVKRDKNAYKKIINEMRNKTPIMERNPDHEPDMENWENRSRKDAYVRGYLAPDYRAESDPEYKWSYSPEQKETLEKMKEFLKSRESHKTGAVVRNPYDYEPKAI
jgi:hypothetical protein|tara:strand:- start:47 stop:679 length:633 start_codon:yes stop_codon:yes gene_type:complete